MNDTPHILIVDDDEGIRQLLGQFLKQHGFETFLAEDGKVMQDILSKESIDMIILDIMLPGDDGLTLCRQLRTQSRIPIIMLTAMGEEIDRIVGLELGADDYLNKPFHPRELLARIRAIFRRTSTTPVDEKKKTQNKTYYFANWILNTGTRQLLSPDKLEVMLSTGEYDLLLVFLDNSQTVLSRDQLLELTKNRLATPFDRSIDIQISRLRYKLEENPKNPVLLKTIRSGGYILATTVQVNKHGS